jgi:hypothetical protein
MASIRSLPIIMSYVCSPTGNIAHRNNPHLSHECPACTTPQEDNMHLLTCSSPSRQAWRSATIHKVTAHKRATSDPYLIDIAHDGLLRLHCQLDPIQPDMYPTKYRALIESQQEIGWDQLYKGRWSVEWRTIQDEFADKNNLAKHTHNGQSWVLSIGRLLLDQWLELWKIRNAERHGKDVELQHQIRRQSLESELVELHNYRNKVCPADRSLFHASVAEHLAQHPTLESLEEWIYTHKDAIKASTTQAISLGIVQNRTLLDFPMFNPIDRTGS